MLLIFTFFFPHLKLHTTYPTRNSLFTRITMPTTTTNTIMTDLPPAYSPPSSPPYGLSDRAADRGNYALAIMQHYLTYNSPSNSQSNSPFTSRSTSPSPDSRSTSPSPDAPTPTPAPGPTPSNPDPQIPRTSRAQRAALRDFHASQDPALWGRRVGHGRQARLIRDENQGFWAWLGGLFVDEDRGRVVVMSAGSPWGMLGPPGYV